MNLSLISAPENVINASQHQSLLISDHQVYPRKALLRPVKARTRATDDALRTVVFGMFSGVLNLDLQNTLFARQLYIASCLHFSAMLRQVGQSDIEATARVPVTVALGS